MRVENKIIPPRFRIDLVWRVALVVMIHMGGSTLMHVVGGIVRGDRGAPSFMTAGFITYGIISAVLLCVAYILLGNRIPIRRGMVRGLIYILLFLGSDYLPQVLGIMGAPSPVINPDSLSFSVVLLDSGSYLVTGIFLGLLLPRDKMNSEDPAPTDRLLLRDFFLMCLCSMFLFPLISFLLETGISSILPTLGLASVFGVIDADKFKFLMIFYGFLSLTGLLLPVLFWLTENHTRNTAQWFRFSIIYGVFLWTPVVLIVIFFGVPWVPTLVFAVMFLATILVDVYVFSHIPAKGK